MSRSPNALPPNLETGSDLFFPQSLTKLKRTHHSRSITRSQWASHTVFPARDPHASQVCRSVSLAPTHNYWFQACSASISNNGSNNVLPVLRTKAVSQPQRWIQCTHAYYYPYFPSLRTSCRQTLLLLDWHWAHRLLLEYHASRRGLTAQPGPPTKRSRSKVVHGMWKVLMGYPRSIYNRDISPQATSLPYLASPVPWT
jgi:hypothetical protein